MRGAVPAFCPVLCDNLFSPLQGDFLAILCASSLAPPDDTAVWLRFCGDVVCVMFC